MASPPPHYSSRDNHGRHNRTAPDESSSLLQPSQPAETYNSIADDGQSIRSAPPPYKPYNDDDANERQHPTEDIEAQCGHYHLVYHKIARTAAGRTKALLRILGTQMYRIVVLLVVRPILAISTAQNWVNFFRNVQYCACYFWTRVLPEPITFAILGGLCLAWNTLVLTIGLLLTALFIILVVGIVGFILIFGGQVLWKVICWLFEMLKDLVESGY